MGKSQSFWDFLIGGVLLVVGFLFLSSWKFYFESLENGGIFCYYLVSYFLIFVSIVFLVRGLFRKAFK